VCGDYQGSASQLGQEQKRESERQVEQSLKMNSIAATGQAELDSSALRKKDNVSKESAY
jgi:hypothetical protein